MMHFEDTITDLQSCVSCEASPGTILIRTQGGVDVAICATCWKLIRDERSARPSSQVPAQKSASSSD
jgi:hypothetical protein